MPYGTEMCHRIRASVNVYATSGTVFEHGWEDGLVRSTGECWLREWNIDTPYIVGNGNYLRAHILEYYPAGHINPSLHYRLHDDGWGWQMLSRYIMDSAKTSGLITIRKNEIVNREMDGIAVCYGLERFHLGTFSYSAFSRVEHSWEDAVQSIPTLVAAMNAVLTAIKVIPYMWREEEKVVDKEGQT